MPRLKQPHCPRGHKYTDKNTTIRRNGSRRCRRCHAEYQRKYLDKKSVAFTCEAA